MLLLKILPLLLLVGLSFSHQGQQVREAPPTQGACHLYLAIAQIAISPPPPHLNGHSGALFFRADLSKFAKSPF